MTMFFLVLKSCERRHAKRRYATYCFPNLLLCFQVDLGWFDEPASSTLPLKRFEVCRATFPPIGPAKAPCTLPEPWRRSYDFLKVDSHEGTCCRDMSRRLCPRDKSHRVNARFSWKILLRGRNFVPATCPLNSNQFELRGHVAATKQRYNPVKRKVASCELFMRHVPATLRKINQSENEITTCPCDKTLRVNTSRNLSPQHAPSCEQRMKFFPATCPCNMSPRVSRPQRISGRADCGTTPQRLRSFCSSGSPAVRRQQEQAPWWRSESKLAKLVASTMDMEPVPELDCELSHLSSPNRATGRKSSGKSGASGGGRPSGVWTLGGEPHGFIRLRFASGEKSGGSSQSNSRHLPGRIWPGYSQGWNWTGWGYWAVMLQNENKDPSNLFMMFSLHVFCRIFQSANF